ncbi:MAG: DUF4199 domain-containing protein [Acidobacteriota bacterium]
MRRLLIDSSILTGLLVLFVLTLLATGPGHSDLLYNADHLLLAAGIVWLHRRIRRAGRSLSFLSAVGSGALATLLAGVGSRLAYFVYLRFVDDSLFAMIADQWRDHLTTQGVDPTAIDERLAGFSPTAWSFATGNLISFCIVGLVLTLAVSTFTRGAALDPHLDPPRIDALSTSPES